MSKRSTSSLDIPVFKRQHASNSRLPVDRVARMTGVVWGTYTPTSLCIASAWAFDALERATRKTRSSVSISNLFAHNISIITTVLEMLAASCIL
jgi:hypothetical protein